MKGDGDEMDWKVNKIEGNTWQKKTSSWKLGEDEWGKVKANRGRSQRKIHCISSTLRLSLTLIQSDTYSSEENRI